MSTLASSCMGAKYGGWSFPGTLDVEVSETSLRCFAVPSASPEAIGHALEEVASGLPSSVTHLYLYGMPCVTQSALHRLLECCPQLTTLLMPAAQLPCPQALGRAEQQRPAQLVPARLSRPPGAWALQQLPGGLRELGLTDCGSLHPTSLVHLRGLTALTRLSLRGLRVPPQPPQPPPQQQEHQQQQPQQPPSQQQQPERSPQAAAPPAQAASAPACQGEAAAAAGQHCPLAASLESWTRLTMLQDLELVGQAGPDHGDPWDGLLPALLPSTSQPPSGLTRLTRLAFHPPSLADAASALAPLERCPALRRLELGSSSTTPLALYDDAWRALAAAPALEQLLLGHCDPRVSGSALSGVGGTAAADVGAAAMLAATLTKWGSGGGHCSSSGAGLGATNWGGWSPSGGVEWVPRDTLKAAEDEGVWGSGGGGGVDGVGVGGLAAAPWGPFDAGGGGGGGGYLGSGGGGGGVYGGLTTTPLGSPLRFGAWGSGSGVSIGGELNHVPSWNSGAGSDVARLPPTGLVPDVPEEASLGSCTTAATPPPPPPPSGLGRGLGGGLRSNKKGSAGASKGPLRRQVAAASPAGEGIASAADATPAPGASLGRLVLGMLGTKAAVVAQTAAVGHDGQSRGANAGGTVAAAPGLQGGLVEPAAAAAVMPAVDVIGLEPVRPPTPPVVAASPPTHTTAYSVSGDGCSAPCASDPPSSSDAPSTISEAPSTSTISIGAACRSGLMATTPSGGDGSGRTGGGGGGNPVRPVSDSGYSWCSSGGGADEVTVAEVTAARTAATTSGLRPDPLIAAETKSENERSGCGGGDDASRVMTVSSDVGAMRLRCGSWTSGAGRRSNGGGACIGSRFGGGGMAAGTATEEEAANIVAAALSAAARFKAKAKGMSASASAGNSPIGGGRGLYGGRGFASFPGSGGVVLAAQEATAAVNAAANSVEYSQIRTVDGQRYDSADRTERSGCGIEGEEEGESMPVHATSSGFINSNGHDQSRNELLTDAFRTAKPEPLAATNTSATACCEALAACPAGPQVAMAATAAAAAATTSTAALTSVAARTAAMKPIVRHDVIRTSPPSDINTTAAAIVTATGAPSPTTTTGHSFGLGRRTACGPGLGAPGGCLFAALTRLSLLRLPDASLLSLAGCWRLQRQLRSLSAADCCELGASGLTALPKLRNLEQLSLLGLTETYDTVFGSWTGLYELRALELGMSRAAAAALAAAPAAVLPSCPIPASLAMGAKGVSRGLNSDNNDVGDRSSGADGDDGRSDGGSTDAALYGSKSSDRWTAALSDAGSVDCDNCTAGNVSDIEDMDDIAATFGTGTLGSSSCTQPDGGAGGTADWAANLPAFFTGISSCVGGPAACPASPSSPPPPSLPLPQRHTDLTHSGYDGDAANQTGAWDFGLREPASSAAGGAVASGCLGVGGWDVDPDASSAVRWAPPMAVDLHGSCRQQESGAAAAADDDVSAAVRHQPYGSPAGGGGGGDKRVHGGRRGGALCAEVAAAAAAGAGAEEGVATGATTDVAAETEPLLVAPLTDVGLQLLLQQLPRLRQLHLHHLPHLTPATLEQVLSRPGLRCLQVNGCRQLTPDCCELLAISAADLTAAEPHAGGVGAEAAGAGAVGVGAAGTATDAGERGVVVSAGDVAAGEEKGRDRLLLRLIPVV